MATYTNPSERFQRLESWLHECKIRSWREDFRSNNEGEFLSRIWSLYGSPDEITYEGFAYYGFLDKETGLKFAPYSGASGPSYGGFQSQTADLQSVLIAFDELLATTALVDCEIEFDTDFGKYRVGVRNGIPFQEELGR